ncbi:MAG: small basic protein [Candidatus Omnitrophica bacterium]|nr:small basic protein [Candidatus Omnitrophota bacterium]
MSQHSSFKGSKGSKSHRTVLKRYEKFAALKEKGLLKEGDSIFGMPKLKIVRVKVKKEKAEEKPAEGAVAATTPAAATTATSAKPKEEKKK